jgi:hypothetical protein
MTKSKTTKAAKRSSSGKAKRAASKPTRAVNTGTASKANENRSRTKSAKPVLLAGGNPQIAKAEGDAHVQTYIAAMPGWKGAVGRRLDELIVRTVPNVHKAVKWNTPFYGLKGEGWFLGVHCMTKYVKVALFRGTSLRPPPPIESKQKNVRYFHIYEDDQLDEGLMVSWISQASKLPGWNL